MGDAWETHSSLEFSAWCPQFIKDGSCVFCAFCVGVFVPLAASGLVGPRFAQLAPRRIVGLFDLDKHRARLGERPDRFVELTLGERHPASGLSRQTPTNVSFRRSNFVARLSVESNSRVSDQSAPPA